jgi:hypothetical protein
MTNYIEMMIFVMGVCFAMLTVIAVVAFLLWKWTGNPVFQSVLKFVLSQQSLLLTKAPDPKVFKELTAKIDETYALIDDVNSTLNKKQKS